MATSGRWGGVVVDLADALVDAPGELDLAVRVTSGQMRVQPGGLPGGEVLDAGEQGAPDPVERVVLVPATAQGGLLSPAPDRPRKRGDPQSMACPASLTTWKASSTAIASGRASRMALA